MWICKRVDNNLAYTVDIAVRLLLKRLLVDDKEKQREGKKERDELQLTHGPN